MLVVVNQCKSVVECVVRCDRGVVLGVGAPVVSLSTSLRDSEELCSFQACHTIFTCEH